MYLVDTLQSLKEVATFGFRRRLLQNFGHLKMVLTNAQRTAFFQDANQLGIPAATFDQMANEGITSENDLVDFDEESIKQMAENLRRPAGGAGPFAFGAKSHKRLLVACDLMRYYQTTGRDATAANLQWTHVMKNFEIQWKALKARKKEDDDPEVPRISKSLPIMKWAESFPVYLGKVLGSRTIPLSYVIRDSVQVPAAAPPLANNQPHSTEHGSVEAELIARASHDHPLFRDDNDKLFGLLEEATRSTSYAASIKPFQRAKDGRGAWLALIAQYAGQDKWEAELRKQEQFLHNRKWKGQSNFLLESFCSQHRNAFVSMQACAEHVQFQLPNEHSRVGFLLDAIECPDAGLQAAMASIRTDNGPDGMRNNFESAVAHLTPYDPVAKKRQGTKRPLDVSVTFAESEAGAVTAAATAANSESKASIGKTGVHLRWHTNKEYKKLTKEQAAELWEWRQSLPDGDPRKSKKKKPIDGKAVTGKQVAAIFKREMKAMMESSQEEKKEEDAVANYISSMVQASLQKASKTNVAAANATNAPPPGKSILKSILKQAKNSAGLKQE